MLKKVLLGISILIGVSILIFIGWLILILSAFGGFDKDYSVSELKENFEENKTEIYELKKYFNEIVPKNRIVEIEFKDNNTLGRFGIKALDSKSLIPNKTIFLDWNLKISTAKMDSIIKPIEWSRETLKKLKEKLDKVDCIQIESGEPTKIGFKRSGMGMYSFNVFSKPIQDKLIEEYKDSCRYILVNKKFVLEYGSGALGSQCLYNFD
ncbi:hypothetical protein [Zunongwangia sp.]|uniref:hypothetical protein n=1 Tax=Zunongwangia sp. TaxID=1965325 RepID=UPI003AA86C86